MVPAERTVTVGIGHGKTLPATSTAGFGVSPTGTLQHEIATFDKLNTWYYADAPRTVQPKLEVERRRETFEEVVKGLDGSNALYEARRCMSCGNCFSCDNCYGVCPDSAVLKLSEAADANVNGYEIDLDFCRVRPLRGRVPCGDRDGPRDDLR